MHGVFLSQSPQQIRKNYETTLAFFSTQKAQGRSLNLNLELGTKLCFAEFLIGQKEFVRAQDLIAEVRELAISDDFFAGYDHGKEAGVMSIADHNMVPGKKFFTWGTRDTSWRDALTDSDGPYIELMAGAYSDNQPDYSWLQPYEVRSFSMNWYPFRGIGGVKQANLEAAVNLEVTNNTATVGFCTTSAHPQAKMTLKAGQKVLLEETAAINPGKPYVKQVAVPAGTDPHDLLASISSGGQELVSYSPIRLESLPMPKPVTSPAAPAEIKTTEELYLTGLRSWQFHSPNVDPNPYWEEALSRDPGDTRVNTTLGMIAFRQARYEDAEKRLRKALERLTDQYHLAQGCGGGVLPGRHAQGGGQNRGSLRAFVQGHLGRGLEGPRLLRPGGDRHRARQHAGGAGIDGALDQRERGQHPGAELEGGSVAPLGAAQGCSAGAGDGGA